MRRQLLLDYGKCIYWETYYLSTFSSGFDLHGATASPYEGHSIYSDSKASCGLTWMRGSKFGILRCAWVTEFFLVEPNHTFIDAALQCISMIRFDTSRLQCDDAMDIHSPLDRSRFHRSRSLPKRDRKRRQFIDELSPSLRLLIDQIFNHALAHEWIERVRF